MSRTTISVPDDILHAIDEVAGPRGRSRFFSEAAVRELKRARVRKAFSAARGIMVGKPGWRSSDEIIQWVNELREEGGRDPGADRGH